MEYTLEDTYDDLKELREYMRKELENVASEMENNDITALHVSCTLNEIKKKQDAMAHSLLKHIPQRILVDFPIPKTTDIYTDALNVLQEEILNTQQLLDRTREQLENIKKDITYLENKKNGFNNMREMYLASVQTLEDKTYYHELFVVKRLFRDVRNDLHKLVDLLFPENKDFIDLLAALSAVYGKGGDDVYIDVDSKTYNYVKFLVEADIVAYHPNDKTKIRLVDLL